MKTHYIPLKQVVPSLWTGGSTYQYFLYPKTSSYTEKNFLFRISSATIEQTPSVFTQFTGYTRYLLMMDNDLDVTVNGIQKLFKKQETFLFSSDDTVISSSLGTDFNWMVSNQVTAHHLEVTHKSQNSSSPFILLYALESVDIRIQEQNYRLEKLSCLIIDNPEEKLITIAIDKPLVFMTLTI